MQKYWGIGLAVLALGLANPVAASDQSDGPGEKEAKHFIAQSIEACEALRRQELTIEEITAAVVPYQERLRLGPPHSDVLGEAVIVLENGERQGRALKAQPGNSGRVNTCLIMVGMVTMNLDSLAPFVLSTMARTAGAEVVPRGEARRSDRGVESQDYQVGSGLVMGLNLRRASNGEGVDHINISLGWMAAQER